MNVSFTGRYPQHIKLVLFFFFIFLQHVPHIARENEIYSTELFLTSSKYMPNYMQMDISQQL